MDASIDTFGRSSHAAPPLLARPILPEADAYIIGGTIATFFVLTAIIPGRKPGSKQKKAS